MIGELVRQLTVAVLRAGVVTIGNGSPIRKVQAGRVNVSPGTVAAGGRATVAVAVPGVAARDIVVLNPPASLESGLVFGGCAVGTGTVTAFLHNTTGASIAASSRPWGYLRIQC